MLLSSFAATCQSSFWSNDHSKFQGEYFSGWIFFRCVYFSEVNLSQGFPFFHLKVFHLFIITSGVELCVNLTFFRFLSRSANTHVILKKTFFPSKWVSSLRLAKISKDRNVSQKSGKENSLDVSRQNQHKIFFMTNHLNYLKV